jgi:large subunit ribosomal protein L1
MGTNKVKDISAQIETREAKKPEEKFEEKPVEVRSHRVNIGKGHRYGKKYKKLAEQVDKSKMYELGEAVELVKKTSPVKFDASIELHVRLNIDPKSAESVRGLLTLPVPVSGKKKKIAAFVDPAKEKEAKDAGADFVGGEELIEKISLGALAFDIAVATPNMMPKLAKIAKILGPKGLMPNPKTGTVSENVGKVIEEFKKGKMEFRADAQGIVHLSVGKVSMSSEDIIKNVNAVLEAVLKAKPGTRANVIKSIFLASTMGPGIRVKVE